jgi:dinuclear metal center YbgI/SA1388 family protein
MAKLCSEIISIIEVKYPLSLAEEYDNVGLQIGNTERSIEKVLVCLDINEAVVEEAINTKANMIVSHHPLIFKPIKKLIYNDPITVMITKLIKADICVYALHTNFDNAENGMNDILADRLELKEINKLSAGTGRYGILYNSMILKDFCALVKSKLNIDYLKVSGNLSSIIKSVAIVGGAGCDFLKDAIAMNCDVLITGDVRHHQAIDGLNANINIIDASHFFTEVVALPYISSLLNTIEGIKAEITKVNTNPFKFI